jgi:hypothetical protein
MTYAGTVLRWIVQGAIGRDERERTVLDYFGTDPLVVFTPFGEAAIPGKTPFAYSVVDDQWEEPLWQQPAAAHDCAYENRKAHPENGYALYSPEGVQIIKTRAQADYVLLYLMVRAAEQLAVRDMHAGDSVEAAGRRMADRVVQAHAAYRGVRRFGGLW